MKRETYKVTIRTLGPVHIGSGRSLDNSDYIYDPSTQMIHVINGRKFVQFLNAHNQLTNYLNDVEKKGRRLNLYTYLTKSTKLPDKWDEFIEYSMRIYAPDKNKLNTIQPFIRDSMNYAYLPGSSLKGAIRSILVGNKRDRDTNQLMGNILVSDSAPIDDQSLVVYQKVDMNKKENPLSLYRECIDVDQAIVTYITINHGVTSIDELKNRLSLYYRNYYNKYLIGFEQTDAGKVVFEENKVPSVPNQQDDEQVMFLGGGVGFAYKTTHYQRYNKRKAREEAFNVLRQRFRHVYGKFTHVPENVPIVLKGTRNTLTDTPYLQGACSISFTKVEVH